MPLTPAQSDSFAHPGARSGIRYTSPVIFPATTANAIAANVIYWQPIRLPGAIIDRIGLNITAGAAGTCRPGLYTNVNGVPSARIVDGGELDTTNIAEIEATITALTLPLAWVWMGVVFSATPSVTVGTGCNSYILGCAEVSVARRGLASTFAYAALPATAPAIASFQTNAPVLYVRKS